MMVADKDELVGQARQLNESNTSGVPIKKRPFVLSEPSTLQPNVIPPLKKSSFIPKTDLLSSSLSLNLTPEPVSNESNKISPSNLNLSASVSEKFYLKNSNPRDLNMATADKSTLLGPSNGLEISRLALVPELHLSTPRDGSRNSTSPVVKEEKVDQCLLGLNLTGQTTVSATNIDVTNNCGKRSILDLNLPGDTWDSALDDFAAEQNASKQTQKVGTFTKQVAITTSSELGVIKQQGGISNNTKLSNMEKLPEKCTVGGVTLDLQLKPPPRPELRMKSLEAACPSDLSLSLIGKDTTEPAKSFENMSQKSGCESSTPVLKLVKNEPCEVNLPEKSVVVATTGSKDSDPVSSGSVKKESLDAPSHQPVGNSYNSNDNTQNIERTVTRPDITRTNSIAKNIDLNSDAVCNDSKTHDQQVTASAGDNYVKIQTGSKSTVPESDETSNSNGSVQSKSLVSKSLSSLSPEKLSHLANKDKVKDKDKDKDTDKDKDSRAANIPSKLLSQKSMVSGCMSQGSADMDFSEDDGSKVSPLTTVDKLKISDMNCHNGENAKGDRSSEIEKEQPGKKVKSENQEDLIGNVVGKVVKEENNVLDRENSGNTITSSSVSSKDKQLPVVDGTAIASNNENGNSDLNENQNNKGSGSMELHESATPVSTKSKLKKIPKKTVANLSVERDRGLKSRSPSTSSKRDSERMERDTKQVGDRGESEKVSNLPSKNPNAFSKKDLVVSRVSSKKIDDDIDMHGHGKRIDSCRTSSFDRTKFRNFSSLSMRDRSNDKLQWGDGSNTRGKRSQRWEGGRYQKLERDSRNEDQSGDRLDSNISNRRRPNNTRYTNRNSNSNHHHNQLDYTNSKHFRFPRRNNNNNESEEMAPHLARFPFRRPRGTDISPGKFVCSLPHEEELDHPVFQQRPPRIHFERPDHTMVRRQRSLSPVQRRGGPPMHINRARSPPTQWSPHRSPEIINGHVHDRVRTPPRRRPYYNNKHLMHRNKRRYDDLAPQEMITDEEFEAMHYTADLHQIVDYDGRQSFEELIPYGSEEGHHHHHSTTRSIRYYPQENNGHAYSDNGGPQDMDGGRFRDRGNEISRLKGGVHGWRDGGEPNNNGLRFNNKKRRY